MVRVAGVVLVAPPEVEVVHASRYSEFAGGAADEDIALADVVVIAVEVVVLDSLLLAVGVSRGHGWCGSRQPWPLSAWATWGRT